MKLICDCGKEIEGYNDLNLNGDKIWECECGKRYILDKLEEEE